MNLSKRILTFDEWWKEEGASIYDHAYNKHAYTWEVAQELAITEMRRRLFIDDAMYLLDKDDTFLNDRELLKKIVVERFIACSKIMDEKYAGLDDEKIKKLKNNSKKLIEKYRNSRDAK